MARKKFFRVGTISKGKFRSKTQSGTGFSKKSKAATAQKFFQKTSRKKVVIRKR